ncbi:squamous cell carcinoma antigen recognized by T-cells 3-like isoform X1 [Hyposmocoma kahamanoa]|uniref:squamous cell carcinoma antigen recognized by T-cells 3-like isoform X1 n=1 Tax=Hyposmocoma kahamanoa TaxID=1477025 RepID=UPI000E6D9538|nr:squamous cell carcinoma antigen recognized by T-cells 3-like isoform X1 [Hyposmocoma kahamanoa]
MAIVEDEVRNESEEENEIEVVVEEDDGDQDSDDSDDDDDEEVLERKVEELERRIAEDPYHYEDHIDLIQALWGLSELDRWRAAFERLQQLSILRAETWLLRLQTEVTLAHSAESREHIASLFQQAALDCYSIPILSEWCSWSLTGPPDAARAQLEEVLRRGGADPLSGKLFWDAKLELEKTQLSTMSENDPEYKAQQERVLWCLEETVSRPLLRSAEAWPPLQELATAVRDDQYIDKIKKQHEAATDYLEKISPFEDKLLTLESADEKCNVYQEYIDTVKELSRDDKYAECDSDGILKVLYDRATTECLSCSQALPFLQSWARLAQQRSSRATYGRVLDACTRRCPTQHVFWTLKMQQAEHEGKHFDEVKAIFETALSKGMETYKHAESLWLSYLEFIRRCTAFDNEEDVERLRRTFRLAWDSLAEAWGTEANDCEIPLYWARLEYKRMHDAKQGKDIFEEIFRYGENKTMSKYWEVFILLESSRDPPLSETKLRDLYRRALKFVTDYPPAVARLWTDYERDYGALPTMRECSEVCEAKIKEWRDNYQALKDKMTGKNQKGKQQNKKNKLDKQKKIKDEPKKGKRKSDSGAETFEVKKRREDMEVDERERDRDSGIKRPHEDEKDEDESKDSKRQRTDSASSSARAGTRDACTLFVSNLEFKVDEQKLRDELSKYGDIMSLRVKTGIKAFGGSICYCQYKTPESVDEALKHDRTLLNGRPMFFSSYSAKKTKQSFKYATGEEKNKLFVKNLPFSHCTKDALAEIFDKYGKLKDVRVVTFKDGKPKGIAYIEYQDESAASQALQNTNGLEIAKRKIDVAFSAPPPKPEIASTSATATSRGTGGASGSDDGLLGQGKRDTGGGMRRTKLSSFIPSVLLKPSTSKATNGANGDHSSEKRPLSNTDFRNMLLNK